MFQIKANQQNLSTCLRNVPEQFASTNSTLTATNLKTAKQWEKMKRKTDVPPQWSIMQSL